MESPHTDRWPATDQVIERFRRWLDDAHVQADLLDAEEDADATAAQPVGLYQLVEQLTSLRHEVKLLTKAARGGEERSEATLLSMQAAIEQFRSVPSGDVPPHDQLARAMVESFVDLDESLRRGRQAMENARGRMLVDTHAQLQAARERFEELYRAQPWWRRVLCRPWHAAIQEVYGECQTASLRQFFDSLLEGYELIQSRLQRTMDEQAIIRMQCLGRQVDPHSMTVIETINDPSRPPGLVVEQVRTGYYWNTKVFRFAEVKAVGDN